MKMLYIIRHAKSDWSIDGQADIDRSLNSRGYNDAHNIGKSMKSKGHLPKLIISSPAIRALSTALIIAEELAYPKSEIKIDSTLYDTSILEYIKAILSVEDEFESVAIFGHNPIVSDLSSNWAGKLIDMPTCAVVRFSVLSDKWSHVTKENIEFIEMLYPKMI